MNRYYLILFLALPSLAFAKSSRTVRLSDDEMELIYVEPGYSTLLKFSSRPEPGLIGDQDGYKVEYLKDIVSIKPLVPTGKTNLFIFTKEGQFNFQLVASRGHHDNIVFVEPKATGKVATAAPSGEKKSVPIDELLTRRMNKSVTNSRFRLTLESLSQPISKSTLVIKLRIDPVGKEGARLDPRWISLAQKGHAVPIENLTFEHKEDAKGPHAEGMFSSARRA